MSRKRSREPENSSEDGNDYDDCIEKSSERHDKKQKREEPYSENDSRPISSTNEKSSGSESSGNRSDPSSEAEANSPSVSNENPFQNIGLARGHFPQPSTYRVPFYAVFERPAHQRSRFYRYRRARHLARYTSPFEAAQSDATVRGEISSTQQAQNGARSIAPSTYGIFGIEGGSSQQDGPTEIGEAPLSFVANENPFPNRRLARGHFPQLARYLVPFYVGLEGRIHPKRKARVLDGHRSPSRLAQIIAQRTGGSLSHAPSENGSRSISPPGQRNSGSGSDRSHPNNPSKNGASTSEQVVNHGVDFSSCPPIHSPHFRFRCFLCPYPCEGQAGREWYCFHCVCYICNKPPSECLGWPEHCTLTDASERSRRLRNRTMAIQKMN